MSVRKDLDFKFSTPPFLTSSHLLCVSVFKFPTLLLLIFSVSLGSNFPLSSFSSSLCLYAQISYLPSAPFLLLLIFSVSLCSNFLLFILLPSFHKRSFT